MLTIGFNSNSSMLASAGVDRNILLWSQSQNFDNVAALKGHSNAVTALTWSHTDTLLTVSADKSLAAWDVEVHSNLCRTRGSSGSTRDTN